MFETPKAEQSVARITISAESDFLPPIVDFLRQMVQRLGLKDEDAERLDRVVEVVCRNIIERAFAPEEDGQYEVYILRRPGKVVIAIEDQGLPFDYARLRDGSDTMLQDMLRHSFADETRFLNLGHRGNRVELIKVLPYADVRTQLFEDEHRRTVTASAAPQDSPVEIRMMRPDESDALSRCVYRSYGYSYDCDDIYYPDRIREFQESGLMRSCVAVSAGDEIVGHLAVMVEHPGLKVGEAGQAVANPRFRGHGLFERMKIYLAEDSNNRGMYGLYSEATAVHPYSQRGNLHLGAKETGYLLGYIPGCVSYKQIGEGNIGRRASVAMMYMKVNEGPERNIYPPARYRDVIRWLVEHNGLRRHIVDVTASNHQPVTACSRMNVNVRSDHNLAFLRVIEPGVDLSKLIQIRVRELCLHRLDCIYVDLSLCHPAAREAGDSLEALGFFFGCIIPEARDGDILRLQYLNNVEINRDDIYTASDFGRGLLETVFRGYETRVR
ncbi:MAG: ATP-binding protein [Gammaproteobacteria bacterium]|nr:ATP-binding protein [Gammaproteobacteria bacterium]